MRERAALGGGYAWYNDFTQEDSQGNVVQTFFGNGVKDSSGWTFAFSDLYGTPRGVCDASKNTVRMAEFTPYGLPYLGMASGAQGGFTGHTFDDVSGFHRAAYRNYSPVLGRWTSREPSGIDGPNLYWYGVSQPHTKVDANGLSAVAVLGGGVVAAAGGALGGGISSWANNCGFRKGAYEGAATGAALYTAVTGTVALAALAGTSAATTTVLGALAAGAASVGMDLALGSDLAPAIFNAVTSTAFGGALAALSGLPDVAGPVAGMLQFDLGFYGDLFSNPCD